MMMHLLVMASALCVAYAIHFISGVATGATHYITVQPDGSFVPGTKDAVEIDEGDTVVFRGRTVDQSPLPTLFLPLPPTFSVIEASLGDIQSAETANSCAVTSSIPYDMTHDDPQLDNMVTGPVRKNSSGIFALGPEEAEGFYEGPANSDCAQIGNDSGAIPANEHEQWDSTTSSWSTSMLCRKGNGQKATETNSTTLLESTWDDPDISGAVVRINWKDLYRSTRIKTINGLSEVIVPDFTKLDIELDRAVRRGKQVFLEVLAGVGTPAWIFEGYSPFSVKAIVDASSTGITPRSVVPISTKDYGSNSEAPKEGCGYDITMGSPGDENYQAAVLTMIEKVAKHIRESAPRYHALSSFKVTGLNFLTGEIRLPQRCLDTTFAGQHHCYCNTKIWATPRGDGNKVSPYEPVAPPTTPRSSTVAGTRPRTLKAS